MPEQDLSWLRGDVPILTSWTVPRDQVWLTSSLVHMHPFMADQVASSSIADRFDRVRATIAARVDELAARAVRRIDDACDVDSLDV